MESITLQTNDSIVGSGELLGQLQFAASSESDGGSATFVVAKVYAQGEGAFSASSNPASIIFATSASDSLPATGRIKVDDNGNLLPLENYQYSIGRSGLAFNNLYANSGYFSSLQVNGVNVSVSGHTHTSSQITDFNESVDDRVNSLLVQGTGVKITYNDSGNTLRLDNLHSEINILSQEPQGFVNRTDSSISFNDSTRTFTIQPTGSSYDVYIEGIKVTKTGIETVVIDSGTALNYIHFDTDTYQLQTKTSFFNFDTDVPIAFIHWNSGINQSTFFGEERHGVRMDSSTHRWIHNTFGMQYIDGLSISNYTLLGDGSSNSHAQIAISDGTLYQEDIIIAITDGDNGVEFTQQLSPTGYFPVYYHSGTTGQWVRDSGTPYPVKYNATRALYNVYTTGNWTVQNVTNNRYFAMWLVATNDINDPILSIMGQREDSSLGSAENNNNWNDIDLTNIPANEIRPLYRLIFITNDTYANTPKSSLQSILDLRKSILTTTYGVPQNDHGNLFGLGDDDHTQYVHINESRTISANHTFTNGLTISNGLLSATSGNFTSLTVNSTGVSLSGHTHTAANITDFNSAVSGLVSGIYASGNGVVSHIAYWSSTNGLTSDSGQLYWDATNNRLGVGTVSPTDMVDVSGTLRVRTLNTASGNFVTTNSSGVLQQRTAAQVLSDLGATTGIGTSGYVTRWISNSGLGTGIIYDNGTNVGIRTSSPVTPLHVYGTLTVDGAGQSLNNYSEGIRIGQASNGYAIVTFGANTASSSGSIANQWWIGKDGRDSGFNIYHSGAGDTFHISTAGYIGLGTNTPQSKLHIKNTLSYGSFRISPNIDNNESAMAFFQDAAGTDNNDAWVVGQGCWANTGDFVIGNENNAAGGNVRFLIEKAGNVGINTTSPAYRLDVAGTGNFTGDVRATGSFIGGSGTAALPSFEFVNDPDTGLFSPATNTFAISTSGTERLRIDNIGNVGIGTTAPSGRLHVVGTGLFASSTGLLPNALLNVYSTASGATLFSVEGTNGNLFSVVDSTSGSLMSVNDITGLGAFEVFSDHSIVAGRYNQNDFVLSSGGNLGLGIALPSGKLHVVGNAIVSGNLGVGTTSPSYKLDVVGTGNFSQNLLVNGTGVSLSGHTHTSSQITDFNSSVSGLLPVIANSGDNRILTSTGSSVGINAESNLTFDGTTLGVTGVISIDQLRLDNNTVITTSGDLVIAPADNYALVASTGGDPRGTFAVDLQNSRIASTQVAAGTYSVIGGGGRNTALRPYSTVCGGLNNLVSGDNSVINGGLSNTIRSTYANINGGSTHTIEVNCSYSNIGGGQNSSIKLAPNSVIAGGYLHSMSGLDNDGTYGFSTIAGGFNNSLIGSYGNFIGAGAFCNITATDGTTNVIRGAAICAGQSNNIAATYSMIGAGTDNTITVSGKYSFIGAGYANTTNSNYSSIVGGHSAKTKLYGENSHAAGKFASAGDAQHTTLVARLETSDGTANQVLFLDGASERLVLSEKTTWTFTIKLSAYNDTDSAAAGWIFRGAIRRNGANGTAIVGSIIEENWKETAMDSTAASVVADDTNEALEIRVTGLAGKNIRWVATVDISQVSYGTP